MIEHPLEPIIDKKSKVLILGSFPSVISRNQSFYYANPQNRFWKVLSAIYNEEIIDRKAFILRHHLALWDVIQSCTIENSNDATIQDVKVNNIEQLIQDYPIQCIILNGKKAESLYKKYLSHLKIQVIACPSTSSANAIFKLDDLIKQYKVIKEIK